MKVTGKTVSKTETSVEIDLFEGRLLPKKVKERAIDEVGNYLVEQTIVNSSQGKSPVSGEGNYPALSPIYKKKKVEEGGVPKPNLELEGAMYDETDFVATKDGLKIGVFGERAAAADGHNNLSGKSKLPQRRFLPDEGQRYRKDIETEAQRIISDVIAEEMSFKAKDFKYVNTRKELYDKLEEIFGPLSRAEIQLAVYRNQELVDVLESLDILRLLNV